MTRKNSKKTAARARQAQFGGNYLGHLNQVGVAGGGGGASGGGEGDGFEPTARVLDEPAYPDTDFEARLDGEHPDVAKMCSWFFRRFDDPAQGVPYDSGEGGFQYVLGGPTNARDELGNAFPEVDRQHVDHAVRLISGYGWDWVPIGLY